MPNPFRRIRLVCRHSPILLKIVVLAAIVLSTAALLMLHTSTQELHQETDALRQEAAALERENAKLDRSIAELGTVNSIKHIATEILGLVEPDASFFSPVDADP